MCMPVRWYLHKNEILVLYNSIYTTDTFKKAVSALGGLEILVNSAGVINESDFTKAIDINVVSNRHN